MSTKEVKNSEQVAKNNIIDEERISEIAKYYLYIGGKLYKKSLDPITNLEELFQITPLAIIDRDGHQYPKEIRGRITSAAPQYLDKINVPSHINYQECITNILGDRFYNEYRPLKHIPIEGSWAHIEELFQHIFGDFFEYGLDYVQLLFQQPLQALPILLLVSKETGTGKSTFCKFLNEIFGQNVLPLTTDILESRFNSYWTGKLMVYVEEQESDGPEDRRKMAKIKNMVTAETLPSEGKGRDPKLKSNFVKIILCSNNEVNPVRIEGNDTRYWVLKVPPLPKEKEEIDIIDECKKEIPAFLHFLLNRTMHTERKNRLWFSPVDIKTDAWRKIVEGSKDTFELSLINLLLDTMNVYGVDELMYSKTELNSIVKNAIQFSDGDRRKTSDLKIKNILRGWGLKASSKNVRHDVYSLDCQGKETIIISRSSNVYMISRNHLQTMTKDL